MHKIASSYNYYGFYQLMFAQNFNNGKIIILLKTSFV